MRPVRVRTMRKGGRGGGAVVRVGAGHWPGLDDQAEARLPLLVSLPLASVFCAAMWGALAYALRAML